MRKSSLFVALLAIVAMSCQEFSCDVVMPLEDGATCTEVNSYVVGIDDALAKLEDELNVIYGSSTRNSLSRPHVRKVHTLYYDEVGASTRSSEVGVNELLYIVEFDDGRGSAVLGADSRLEDVYAVLEEGVISKADFQRAELDSINPELPTYLAGLILDEVDSKLFESLTSSLPVVPAVPTLPTYKEVDTLVNRRNSFYVRTKWYQDSPFNNECIDPLNPGVVNKAGCGPIAIGQILAHNQQYGNLSINNQTFDMSLINCKRPWHDLYNDSSVNSEVARFIHQIGLEMDADYGTSLTITAYDKMEEFLSNVYSNVEDEEYDFDTIISHMDEYSLPLAIYDVLHGWVIDGYYWLNILYRIPVETLPGAHMVYKIENKKVHCNFGWGGNWDGYYSSAIFDLSNPAMGDDIVSSIGDHNSSTTNINLSDNLRVVYYNL